MKKFLFSVASLCLIGVACNKDELTTTIYENSYQSEMQIDDPWWSKALGKLLKKGKTVEISFGHNTVEGGICVNDQICKVVVSGGINTDVGDAKGIANYNMHALEVLFIVETISSVDMANFSNGAIQLSSEILRVDFGEMADEIGLPLDFAVSPGIYQIIFSDDERIVVRFE